MEKRTNSLVTRKIRPRDPLLRSSFCGQQSPAAFLVRPGLLGVWLWLSVPDFHYVLARRWHADVQRCDGHTAPEAVVRSPLYLRRLPDKRLAGPRLVRRLPSVRFSGGFAGPGESITGCPCGLYDAVAPLGVHVQRHASTAVVSTA